MPAATPHGLAALTDKLLRTMQEERAALGALHAQLTRQLDALRGRSRAPLEDATHAANDLLGRLDGLRQTRARQTRLLRRLLNLDPNASALAPVAEALEARGAGDAARRLRHARQDVRAAAAAVQQQGEALSYALQYAIGLGREMLSLLHQADAAAPPATYTAAGQTAATTSAHSLVNHLG